jgi:Transposase DDE domain
MKVLFGLALRQTQGFVQSVLGLSGLDWQAPDYSTMSRRKKRLTVEIQARPSTGGLHLLVDSTRIKMLCEGEWKTRKHGAEYRRQWRKVHLGIDAETLEMRAIEVTDNGVGDAPMLPELLWQIPAEEAVLSVSGDGAYDTQGCHDAIAEPGAEAVLQAAGRAGDGAHLRAAGGGVAGAGRSAQPLHPPGHPGDADHGLTPSGVRETRPWLGCATKPACGLSVDGPTLDPGTQKFGEAFCCR